jgi:beta-lactamase regulating signal transducer with metallopeptidase domain/HEAT repeat protein
MVPTIVSDIAALPGWNGPMLLLLAKATLILIAALGITVAMSRGSAGARHLVWLATLGTLLLVPAVTAWAPPLRLAILPAKPQPALTTTPASPKSEAAPRNETKIDQQSASPAVSTPSQNIVTPDSGSFAFDGISLMFAIWAGVALLLAGWLGYGALAVRRIVRNSHPLDTQDWLTPLWEVADRLELEEPPRLLGSPDAKMPFACGFLKPTIVLPNDCESWSADRRRAVLLHELAHVKRHDLVGHTLGRFACAIYWFHPLVWTAAKQLRNESERACDDLALSCGARASDYAEHLLDIVTSVRRDSTPVVALAMARRKEFEGRMLAILDPELRHSSPSRRQSLALIGSLALIAVVVGAAAPARRVAEAPSRVATKAPAIDPDFTPQDSPGQNPVNEKKQEKAVEKAMERSMDKPIDRSVDKSVDKTLETITRETTNTVTNEAMRVVKSSDLSGVAAKALAQLGANIGNLKVKTEKAAKDDRPILLANVLRTEADPSLRRTAAWGLSEYADTKVAIDALSDALRKDSDASVREMAAWSLAEGDGTSTSVAALSNAIRHDANESVRATAVWSLGQVGDRYAVDPLVDALTEKSKRIRTRAIWAIGNIGTNEAPRALLSALRDPDPEVRELTAWALYQIEDPSTIDELNAALKSETSKDLQVAYIRALAALGEKSVDAVRGLLTSSDPKIKSMAIRALAGGNAAGPWPWPWPEPRPFP